MSGVWGGLAVGVVLRAVGKYWEELRSLVGMVIAVGKSSCRESIGVGIV